VKYDHSQCDVCKELIKGNHGQLKYVYCRGKDGKILSIQRYFDFIPGFDREKRIIDLCEECELSIFDCLTKRIPKDDPHWQNIEKASKT